MEIKEKKVQVNKIILSQPNKEKQKQNIYYLMKNRQSFVTTQTSVVRLMPMGLVKICFLYFIWFLC